MVLSLWPSVSLLMGFYPFLVLSFLLWFHSFIVFHSSLFFLSSSICFVCLSSSFHSYVLCLGIYCFILTVSYFLDVVFSCLVSVIWSTCLSQLFLAWLVLCVYGREAQI